MRLTICLTAAIALCACSKQAEAPPAADNVAEANVESPAATPAAFQLNETSWTFTEDGTKVQESIDANGNFVATSAAGKHIDHGTAAMKADKACFDSAMDKEGETCWTTKPVEIGQSMDTVSDKGEKLTVTRVAYVPVAAPK